MQLAVLILLGTGMRLSELCALTVEDFEDDGDHSFLKVKRGKGAKFRRVPVSHRLRREILRYLNHVRPDSRSDNLLLLSGGQPVRVETCSRQLNRAGQKVGCRVHAHKFRHTFATTYLRKSGDIERLRKILGHSTYAMVMRYVHLDASDLDVDFERRTPYCRRACHGLEQTKGTRQWLGMGPLVCGYVQGRGGEQNQRHREEPDDDRPPRQPSLQFHVGNRALRGSVCDKQVPEIVFAGPQAGRSCRQFQLEPLAVVLADDYPQH
jgi:hypothetical protein